MPASGAAIGRILLRAYGDSVHNRAKASYAAPIASAVEAGRLAQPSENPIIGPSAFLFLPVTGE